MDFKTSQCAPVPPFGSNYQNNRYYLGTTPCPMEQAVLTSGPLGWQGSIIYCQNKKIRPKARFTLHSV